MSSNLTSLLSKQKLVNLNLCIICQEQGKGDDLSSTTTGRQNVMNAAEIRKDEVWEHLRSYSVDSEFKYHMNNKCYKSYTHKNKLSKITAETEKEENEPVESKNIGSLSPKRTRYVALF